jgi:hypothetical protein
MSSNLVPRLTNPITSPIIGAFAIYAFYRCCAVFYMHKPIRHTIQHTQADAITFIPP